MSWEGPWCRVELGFPVVFALRVLWTRGVEICKGARRKHKRADSIHQCRYFRREKRVETDAHQKGLPRTQKGVRARAQESSQKGLETHKRVSQGSLPSHGWCTPGSAWDAI